MPSLLPNPTAPATQPAPAPPQTQLDPASAAGPGVGGAATAAGVAASTPPDATPPVGQQPATPAQPEAPAQPGGEMPTMQPMSMSWQPGATGSPLYPDGQGPVTGQVPSLAEMFSAGGGPETATTAQDMSMAKLSRQGLLAPGFAKQSCRVRKPYSKTVRSAKVREGKWEPSHRFQGSKTSKVKQASLGRTALDLATAGSFGGLLGAPIGAIQGFRKGNTAEGLGRGVLRGGATTIGAGLGSLLGQTLAASIAKGNPAAAAWGSGLGLLGGGAAGFLGSGKLLGPAGYSGERAGRRGLTDAEEQELEDLEQWQLENPSLDQKKMQKLEALQNKLLQHYQSRGQGFAVKRSSLERSAVGESGLTLRERPWSLQGSEAWPSKDEMWSSPRRWDSKLPPKGRSKMAEGFIRRCRELGLDDVQTQAAMAKAATADPRIAEDFYGTEKQGGIPSPQWLKGLAGKGLQYGRKAWRWARGVKPPVGSALPPQAGVRYADKTLPAAKNLVQVEGRAARGARKGWQWLRGAKNVDEAAAGGRTLWSKARATGSPQSNISQVAPRARTWAANRGTALKNWWRGYSQSRGPVPGGVIKSYPGGKPPGPAGWLYRPGAAQATTRAGLGAFTGYQMGNTTDDSQIDNLGGALAGGIFGFLGNRLPTGGAARAMLNRAMAGTLGGYGLGAAGELTGYASPGTRNRLAQVGGWGGLLSKPGIDAGRAFLRSPAKGVALRGLGGAVTGGQMTEVDSDSSWDNLLGAGVGAITGGLLPKIPSRNLQTGLKRMFAGTMGGQTMGELGEALGLLPEGSSGRLAQAGGLFGLGSPYLARGALKYISPEAGFAVNRAFRTTMESPWKSRVLKSFFGKGRATNTERAMSLIAGWPAVGITTAVPAAWSMMQPVMADAVRTMVADSLPYVTKDPETGQLGVNITKLMEEQPEVANKVIQKGTEAFIKSDPELAKVAIRNGWLDQNGTFSFGKFKQDIARLASLGSTMGGAFGASPLGSLIGSFMSMSPLQQLLMAGGLILGLGGLMRGSGTSSLIGLLMAGAGLLGPSLLGGGGSPQQERRRPPNTVPKSESEPIPTVDIPPEELQPARS